jgi:DNA-directed RNA polymerase specialized sigma24 family protein
MDAEADEIARCIPILRRHASLLTGCRQQGDRQVRRCLEQIMATPGWRAGDSVRTALFRVLHAGWPAAAPSWRDPVRTPVEQGLAALSLPDRRVLLLAVVEDFTLDEIGQILGWPRSRVEGHLARARAALHRRVAATALIIEDEPLIAMRTARIVREMGFSISDVAMRADDAIAAAANEPPGLVVADIQLMQRDGGLVAAARILQDHEVPIVFVTGFPERLQTQGSAEPAFVVAKPFLAESLKSAIARALTVYASPTSSAAHRQALLGKLQALIGAQPCDRPPLRRQGQGYR